MVCWKLSACLSVLGTVTGWFDASVALRFAGAIGHCSGLAGAEVVAFSRSISRIG